MPEPQCAVSIIVIGAGPKSICVVHCALPDEATKSFQGVPGPSVASIVLLLTAANVSLQMDLLLMLLVLLLLLLWLRLWMVVLRLGLGPLLW